MTNIGNASSAIGGIFIVLSVIVAVTVLTWHGSITGEAAVGILGGFAGFGGGAAAVHAGVRQGMSR